MRELLTQHGPVAWVFLVALLAFLLLALLLIRRRRVAGAPQPLLPKASERAAKLDRTALKTAVDDAEARGERGRLPGLYLSLALCHVEDGEREGAGELLRKSIRGAVGSEHRETHAKARLALGDLAHASGDLTTACEHWQIARALFHELKRPRDHEAAESRMLRNGCPTDWVLTDF